MGQTGQIPKDQLEMILQKKPASKGHQLGIEGLRAMLLQPSTPCS